MEQEEINEEIPKGGERRPASKQRFRGIRQCTYGRWAAEIRDKVINGACVWISTFDTVEEAVLA
uniref:AP2/ERF domain-containing protein n=1 Tax=Oryza punctata TaxID=4537 RepID=A0A0E0LU84_ORYPU